MVQLSIRQVLVDSDFEMQNFFINGADRLVLSSQDNLNTRMLTLGNDASIKVNGHSFITADYKLDPSAFNLASLSQVAGTPGYFLTIAAGGSGLTLVSAPSGGGGTSGITGITTKYDASFLGTTGNTTSLVFSIENIIDPVAVDSNTIKVPYLPQIIGGGITTYQPFRRISLSSGITASYDPVNKAVDLSVAASTGGGGGSSQPFVLTADITTSTYNIKQGSFGAYLTLANGSLEFGLNASTGVSLYKLPVAAPTSLGQLLSVTNITGTPQIGFVDTGSLPAQGLSNNTQTSISGYGANKILTTDAAGLIKWVTSVAGSSGITSINSQTGPGFTIGFGTGIALANTSNTVTISNTGVLALTSLPDLVASGLYSLKGDTLTSGSLGLRRLEAGTGITITEAVDSNGGTGQKLRISTAAPSIYRNAFEGGAPSTVGVGVVTSNIAGAVAFKNIRAGDNITLNRTDKDGIPAPTNGQYITIQTTTPANPSGLVLEGIYAVSSGGTGLNLNLGGTTAFTSGIVITTPVFNSVCFAAAGIASSGFNKGVGFSSENNSNAFSSAYSDYGLRTSHAIYGSYHYQNQIGIGIEACTRAGIVMQETTKIPLQLIPQHLTTPADLFPGFADPATGLYDIIPTGDPIGTYEGVIALKIFDANSGFTQMPNGGPALVATASGRWWILPLTEQTFPDFTVAPTHWRILTH